MRSCDVVSARNRAASPRVRRPVHRDGRGLVWRDGGQLPPPDRKTYGRDQFYDEHLAGKPVLDSLLVAERFLTVVMPATT